MLSGTWGLGCEFFQILFCGDSGETLGGALVFQQTRGLALPAIHGCPVAPTAACLPNTGPQDCGPGSLSWSPARHLPGPSRPLFLHAASAHLACSWLTLSPRSRAWPGAAQRGVAVSEMGWVIMTQVPVDFRHVL